MTQIMSFDFDRLSIDKLSGVEKLDDFEKYARQILPSATKSFFINGADDELSKCDNEAVFSRYYLLPRIRPMKQRSNLNISLFGMSYRTPIGIAPTGLHKLAHLNGEIETAVGLLQL